MTLGVIKLSLLLSIIIWPGAVPDQQESGSVLTGAQQIMTRGLLAVAANTPFSTSPPVPTPGQGNGQPTQPDNAEMTGAMGASVVPPAPKIRPNQSAQSPFAQSLPEYARPDEAKPQAPPSPTVSPFVPRDSAQRKQEELNRREQELLALQQQMQSRLDELKNIEGKVQTMLKEADNTQDDKLRHLVDVYTNMKAKQAAEVLTNLDERIAVRILAGMRGRQAGEILTYMNAEKAAKLSEALTRTQLPK